MNAAIRVRTFDGSVKELTGSAKHPITVKTGVGTSASIYLSSDASGITIAAASIPVGDWYSAFVSRKRKAMLSGGQITRKSDGFSFSDGLTGGYGFNFVRTIANCKPSATGNINILGNGQISIYPKDGALALGAAVVDNTLQKLLTEVYQFTWALYHAINYLATRILYFNPAKKDEVFNCLGYCNGSLLEYQSQLAVYNHKIWQTTYALNVDSVVEKVSIGLGCVATDCHVKGVLILADLSVPEGIYPAGGAGNNANKIADAFNALTIFRYGKSVNAGGLTTNTEELSPVNVAMIKMFDDEDTPSKIIHGTGYEAVDESDDSGGSATGSSGSNWSHIKIALLLGPMTRRQRYYEVFSLAVGTGALKDLQLPATESGSHRFNIHINTSWWIIADSDYDPVSSLNSLLNSEAWYKNKALENEADKYATAVRRSTVAHPLAVNVILSPDEEES